MHEKALEVLEQIGIRVTSKQILRRIAKAKRFEIRDCWVRIRRDLIEELLAEIRRRPRKERVMDEEEIILSLGYPGCSYVIDLETDRLEPDRSIEQANSFTAGC